MPALESHQALVETTFYMKSFECWWKLPRYLGYLDQSLMESNEQKEINSTFICWRFSRFLLRTLYGREMPLSGFWLRWQMERRKRRQFSYQPIVSHVNWIHTRHDTSLHSEKTNSLWSLPPLKRAGVKSIKQASSPKALSKSIYIQFYIKVESLPTRSPLCFVRCLLDCAVQILNTSPKKQQKTSWISLIRLSE